MVKRIILETLGYIGIVVDKIHALFKKDLIVDVLSNEDTLSLIQKGKSISRFGDGEFMIILNKSISNYQECNENLSNELINVLNSKDEGLLIGVPYIFKNFSEINNYKDKLYWGQYIVRNYLNLKRILSKKVYYSSQVTRFYMNRQENTYAKELFDKWKSILREKSILIVEGDMTKFGIGNDFLDGAKHIERIVVPHLNSFSYYNNIIEYLEMIDMNKYNIVLVSLGPTATVLTRYIYTKYGIQTIDIGHLDIEYTWFLNQMTETSSVVGKRVYENKKEQYSEDLSDSDKIKYLGEIVHEVL